MAARSSASTASTLASGRRVLAQPLAAARHRVALALDLEQDPGASLRTQPLSSKLVGEPVDEGAEANPLDGPAHPGPDPAPPLWRLPAHVPGELDQLAQHVVRARLRLLDPRDVLERVTITWSASASSSTRPPS